MASLELLDHRRQVAEIYRRVRNTDDHRAAWDRWRLDRQRLFAEHPQSAWEPESRTGRTLDYFPYDPDWRFEDVEVSPIRAGPATDIGHSAEGATATIPLATVTLDVAERPTLTVFWLAGYGGGLFLPFRDATNGRATYGGGRYLLDTAKGADLGGHGDRLILDFNYAYHPSCVHSDRWSCPLPPPENALPMAVRAGERLS